MLNLSDIAKDVDSLKESIEDKKSGETSEPQSQPDGDSGDIELSDKKMYQQGDHFNEHGREMGYGSKKEYEAAAREFLETNKDTADIYEGVFNSQHGRNNLNPQYIIQADGKTLIVDKATGQLIDFYNTIGSVMDSFIDIVKIQ